MADKTSDIVERLRKMHEGFTCEHTGNSTAPVLTEAADEIERLWKALQKAGTIAQTRFPAPAVEAIADLVGQTLNSPFASDSEPLP